MSSARGGATRGRGRGSTTANAPRGNGRSRSRINVKPSGAPKSDKPIAGAFAPNNGPTKSITKSLRDNLQNHSTKATNKVHSADSWKPRFKALNDARDKERDDAIRNGLMADPEKPRALSDAITLVGTCQDMCAEYERVQRVVQRDVWPEERAVDYSEYGPGEREVDEARMVKKFRRSAAGVEEQLPSDLRPPTVLKRTCDYLFDEIIGGAADLASVHHFVWDRTRAIRNDFSIQEVTKVEDLQIAIDCYERIARFHIVSLHTLAGETRPYHSYDAQQEREQLDRTMLSLTQYYDDCRRRFTSPNEAEFRAYSIIFQIQGAQDMEDRIQTWPVHIIRDQRVLTALQLFSAAGNNIDLQGPLRPRINQFVAQQDWERFWVLISSKRVSFLMACISEIYFNVVRRTVLNAVWRAFRVNPRLVDQHWKPSILLEMLAFDEEFEVVNFCQSYGFSFRDCSDGDGTYLDLTSVRERDLPEPDKTLVAQTKTSIVEGKRLGRTVRAVINGMTVTQAQAAGLTEEEEDVMQEDSTYMNGTDQADHDGGMNSANDTESPLFVPQFGAKATLPSTSTPFAAQGTFGQISNANQSGAFAFGNPSVSQESTIPLSSPFALGVPSTTKAVTSSFGKPNASSPFALAPSSTTTGKVSMLDSATSILKPASVFDTKSSSPINEPAAKTNLPPSPFATAPSSPFSAPLNASLFPPASTDLSKAGEGDKQSGFSSGFLFDPKPNTSSGSLLPGSISLDQNSTTNQAGAAVPKFVPDTFSFAGKSTPTNTVGSIAATPSDTPSFSFGADKSKTQPQSLFSTAGTGLFTKPTGSDAGAVIQQNEKPNGQGSLFAPQNKIPESSLDAANGGFTWNKSGLGRSNGDHPVFENAKTASSSPKPFEFPLDSPLDSTINQVGHSTASTTEKTSATSPTSPTNSVFSTSAPSNNLGTQQMRKPSFSQDTKPKKPSPLSNSFSATEDNNDTASRSRKDQHQDRRKAVQHERPNLAVIVERIAREITTTERWGLLDQFVEYEVGRMVAAIQEELYMERIQLEADAFRKSTLAHRYGLRWKEFYWRRRRVRHGRERRARARQSLLEHKSPEMTRASSSRRQILVETPHTRGRRSDQAAVEDQMQRSRESSVASSIQQVLMPLKSRDPSNVSGAHVRTPANDFVKPGLPASAVTKGVQNLNRSAYLGFSMPLNAPDRTSTTQTNYFRLKAMGVDSSAYEPFRRAKRQRTASIESASDTSPPSLKRLTLPSSSPETRVSRVSPASELRKSTLQETDDALFARLRAARQGLTEATQFIKSNVSKSTSPASLVEQTHKPIYNDSPSLWQARSDARRSLAGSQFGDPSGNENVPAYRLRESRFVPREQYGRAIERANEIRAARSHQTSPSNHQTMSQHGNSPIAAQTPQPVVSQLPLYQPPPVHTTYTAVTDTMPFGSTDLDPEFKPFGVDFGGYSNGWGYDDQIPETTFAQVDREQPDLDVFTSAQEPQIFDHTVQADQLQTSLRKSFGSATQPHDVVENSRSVFRQDFPDALDPSLVGHSFHTIDQATLPHDHEEALPPITPSSTQLLVNADPDSTKINGGFRPISIPDTVRSSAVNKKASETARKLNDHPSSEPDSNHGTDDEDEDEDDVDELAHNNPWAVLADRSENGEQSQDESEPSEEEENDSVVYDNGARDEFEEDERGYSAGDETDELMDDDDGSEEDEMEEYDDEEEDAPYPNRPGSFSAIRKISDADSQAPQQTIGRTEDDAIELSD